MYPSYTGNTTLGSDDVSGIISLYGSNVKVSGTATVCSGSTGTFTATNWQPGYTWVTSSNATIVSGQGTNTVTVSGTPSVWTSFVRVLHNTSASMAEQNFWVGPPSSYAVIQEDPSIPSYYCVSYDYFSNITSFKWEVVNGCGYEIVNNGSSCAFINFWGWNCTYTLKVTLTNACGSIVAYQDFYTKGGPPSYAYPNPVDDILTVDVDALARQYPSAPVFDIRLYDSRGSLFQQQNASGGTVQFNVSVLPNGICYLHVYNGISGKPEIQKIIVQH